MTRPFLHLNGSAGPVDESGESASSRVRIQQLIGISRMIYIFSSLLWYEMTGKYRMCLIQEVCI